MDWKTFIRSLAKTTSMAAIERLLLSDDSPIVVKTKPSPPPVKVKKKVRS